MNLQNNNLLEQFILENKKPKEEFKVLEGTERKYYVSNFGRVASGAEQKPRFLDPWIDSKGYQEITIYYPKGKK